MDKSRQPGSGVRDSRKVFSRLGDKGKRGQSGVKLPALVDAAAKERTSLPRNAVYANLRRPFASSRSLFGDILRLPSEGDVAALARQGIRMLALKEGDQLWCNQRGHANGLWGIPAEKRVRSSGAMPSTGR